MRRKLLLSIFALLFAMISLATSTYAWLSISKVSTVSGLSLNVTSEDSLLVAHKATTPEAAD